MLSRNQRVLFLLFVIGVATLSILFLWRNNDPVNSLTPSPEVIGTSPPLSDGPIAPASASPKPSAVTRRAETPKFDLHRAIQNKLRDWHNEPDSREQLRLLQELVALITDENAAGIVQSLSSDDLAGPFGIAAFDRWLTSDPSLAAEWIAMQPNTTAEQATLVARALSGDRNALQSYLNRLSDGDWKEQVLSGAGSAFASSDPQQALAFASRMKPSEAKNGLLQTVAFEWSRQDPESARTWSEQTSDPTLREQLIASAAKGLAENDPREAAQWLVASVKDQDLLVDAAQSIIRLWAASEPSATADWVVLFPDGRAREEALETLISFWATADSSAAKDWILRLPDGPIRQTASGILNRTTLAAAH